VTPSPTATPTSTPTPTPTAQASTVTPTPTVTPSPTATPSPSPSTQPSDPITGNWSGDLESLPATLTINSNGTCNGVASTVHFTGTWSRTTPGITIPGNYTGELQLFGGIKFNATLTNENTLELSESGTSQESTFTRDS
jgi:hypothetical protein